VIRATILRAASRAWLLCFILHAPCAADSSATEKAATTRPLSARITEVVGLVQVRMDESAPWQNAAVNMVLSASAEFRTGPRSRVSFIIPPAQSVTLDRLGTVKLIEAVSAGGRVKTDLAMKYGRVDYAIEAAGVEHEATIYSPGSLLGVRGTVVRLYDQPPFAPEAVSFRGRALFRNARGQIVSFGGTKKTTVESEAATPAQTAMGRSVLDSEAVRHAEQRSRELAAVLQHRGQFLGNVAYVTRPVSAAELRGLLSGGLDFVLRWNAPAPVDLNLVVRTPLGETVGNPPFILSLFPNDPRVGRLLASDLPQSTASGGHAGLNHIGPAGIEIVSFPGFYPSGTYIVAAYNFVPPASSGEKGEGPRTPFRIEAFLHGKRQQLVLNLAEALTGAEPPRFGPVFTGSAAVGEMESTALRLSPAQPRPPASPQKHHLSQQRR